MQALSTNDFKLQNLVNLHCQDDDCGLDLFQSCDQFDVPNNLKKIINNINAMIELEYIDLKGMEPRFTNTGLNYMIRKHDEFMSILSDLDQDELYSMPQYGPIAQQLIKDYQNKTRDTAMEFDLKNMKIETDEGPDYNNHWFGKKNDEVDDPQG